MKAGGLLRGLADAARFSNDEAACLTDDAARASRNLGEPCSVPNRWTNLVERAPARAEARRASRSDGPRTG